MTTKSTATDVDAIVAELQGEAEDIGFGFDTDGVAETSIEEYERRNDVELTQAKRAAVVARLQGG